MNKHFYHHTFMLCIKRHPGFFCQDKNIVTGLQEVDCVFQMLQLQATPEKYHYVPEKVKSNVIEQINDLLFLKEVI